MATRRLIYKGSLNGTAPILRWFQVGDNQTLYEGDVLAMSSNKAVAAADAAGAGTVLGVAASAKTTTTAATTDIILVDINPASVYAITYTGTAPVSGNKYDFGTAPYTLDGDDTSGGFMQVLPQPDGSGADTTNTRADVILCNRVYGMA